jgi:hypothetical protein
LGRFAPSRLRASSLSSRRPPSSLWRIGIPSIHDVLSNVVGAILGVAIASHCKLHRPALAVSQVKSQIAAVLALTIVVAVWLTSDDGMVSTRGVTSPGRLEAYWKLDESSGRIAEDSAGHGISGRFSKEPNRVDSETGRAVLLDGSNDNVDFGFSTALRLARSMTITAWVKSTSYPIDDAAIVSSLLSRGGTAFAGYQLDTTVDSGPRTIGFKIANECRQLPARYGATPQDPGDQRQVLRPLHLARHHRIDPARYFDAAGHAHLRADFIGAYS